MPYRPRELVIRAREAAHLLLAALDRNEMVPRFLDMYAAENRRPGRADQPAHYRDQLETIRREAILAMVLRAEAALPTKLKVHVVVRGAKPRAGSRTKLKKGKAKKGVKVKRKTRTSGIDLAIPLLDLFREEFFVALGQALRWSDDEARSFWHDLELYEQLQAKEPKRAPRRAIASGPFVDRTALLLDPSLMEQARRAAGKFQMELDAAADRVLRTAFSKRRWN
jgi:hypothetical protein